jgi:leucyl/phenylalanyl-tRNA--protein transferase
MLPFLSKNSPFPPIEQALKEPNGLLAYGADLSSHRLLSAYKKGIFPWYEENTPILWWSPNPRSVFYTDGFNPSKSLCRFAKKITWKITLNTDFYQVIRLCSDTRKKSGTWINHEIIKAYYALHLQGHAHSVEVWNDSKMIGGIYGISIGRVFCGESMFSLQSQASKIALTCLMRYLHEHHFPFLDAQINNPHLEQLGVSSIPRQDFIKHIKIAMKQKQNPLMWKKRTLSLYDYVRRMPS